MSQFSRVKKNDDLYKEINLEDKTKIIESSLRDYERRTTDPHSNESKYQASRYRKNYQLAKELENAIIEEENELEKDVIEQNDGDFQAEKTNPLKKEEILRDRNLLEEFIEEVKHYNINRGLRNVQDTQMNILQNLAKGRSKEDQSIIIDPIKPQNIVSEQKTDLELTQEIQAIISELDDEVDYLEKEESQENKDQFVFTPLDKDKDAQLTNIFEEIIDNSKAEKPKNQSLVSGYDLNQENLDDIEEVENIIVEDKLELEPTKSEVVKRDYKSSELLELTQTLNLKLDLQEAELEEVSKKVNIIDRILSFFVAFLVMALLAVIFYGIYWVYVERGGF